MKSLFEQFEDEVQKSGASSDFEGVPAVAMLSGPSVIIEAIVRKASATSGIPMNWGFIGGRAIVYSKGDHIKARSALYCAIPKSDLTEEDLFNGILIK